MYSLRSTTVKLKLSCKRLPHMEKEFTIGLAGDTHTFQQVVRGWKWCWLEDRLSDVALMEGKGINEERINTIQREEDLRVGRKGIF